MPGEGETQELISRACQVGGACVNFLFFSIIHTAIRNVLSERMLFVAISFSELWLLFQLHCLLELTLAGNLKCTSWHWGQLFLWQSISSLQSFTLKLAIQHSQINTPLYNVKLSLHSLPIDAPLTISQKRYKHTVEALVSGHPRDAKKVFVTGAGHLREFKNTEFVWELRKTHFVKVAISRAFRLRERPLGEHPLYS